jgi:aminomethyltransferase
MPVQYAGIREEHAAVRENAGMFDVSHMGQLETSGPDVLPFLQRLLSNDVAAIPVGGAQYSVLCREDGGVLDDVFTYRLEPDRFLTVTNASNHARDLAWFQSHAGAFDVELADRVDDYVMLAVQGPAARALVRELAERDLPARFAVEDMRVAGVGALVCGTGYTGEDGVEILCAPIDAFAVWDALAARGVTPVGLGARDTLRLEVCFHLYGNDLMETRGPIEAGLGWCCKEQTGFIGADAVSDVRVSGPSERLVPFRVDGSGIARAGDTVVGGGEVTSGTFSPSLGVGIGMAYLPAGLVAPGRLMEIDVRGRTRSAVIVERPIYRLAGS